MPDVRIFRPAKSAMQSGYRNTRRWTLQFEPAAAKKLDPLMGWAGSVDTRGQIRMPFDSKDEAVAYADRHDLSYQIVEPHSRRIRPKCYADNFRFQRVE
jgi:hypothetical protein